MNITVPNNSVTSPATTWFTGSVSSGKISFLTKLRCSRITNGARPAGSEKPARGAFPPENKARSQSSSDRGQSEFATPRRTRRSKWLINNSGFENGPEHVAERAPIARQDVAPRHGAESAGGSLHRAPTVLRRNPGNALPELAPSQLARGGDFMIQHMNLAGRESRRNPQERLRRVQYAQPPGCWMGET